METRFEILENGNLKLIADAEALAEVAENNNINLHDNEAVICELFEYELCNGFGLVHSMNKGLTEAPAITDSITLCIHPDDWTEEDTLGDDTNVWWFPDYQVISVFSELSRKGYCIFIKA